MNDNDYTTASNVTDPMFTATGNMSVSTLKPGVNDNYLGCCLQALSPLGILLRLDIFELD